MESNSGLRVHGVENILAAYWNLPAAAVYEQAVRRGEGAIANVGPLVVRTGHYTGRSPNDKFIVREPSSASRVWWGEVNQPMEPERFEALRRGLLAHLQGRELFVQDCFVGADPNYRFPIRVITEYAWHSLFARNMCLQATAAGPRWHGPRIVVIAAPRFHANPWLHGTNSEAFIVLDFASGGVFIGGTAYAGEIKKAVFSLLNYE
ncbi:MAG: phosphoenolpyruvate carboxykinase (ATP), partial [Gammaproteobacteria bacterium]|nr:phosphoenolpyruvate carboxykinase (ATP) [Gammaproteobacteria bacterium]NIV20375.1 phosphoenolpyruvate carboxykinase (ATP) [Gammaproteobacteria bacterium]NIY32023.1 phosphoenolpyruvate carboxykinase (ATP) [Gammaproteobacteria bacterium]